MDDRLLALSRAREALRALGVESAEQFLAMDHAAYERLGAAHFGLVSRIVAYGNADANAALWTDLPWRVISLHPHDPHSLLYLDAPSLPVGAYDDEAGMRRCWRLLITAVGPHDAAHPDGRTRVRRM